MTKNEYMKFLETSRDGGVISNAVIDAIIDHIQSYNGDVDWNRVEERLEAYASGWLIYAQDLMEFYSKNYNEVDSIVSQGDALSVIDAIGSVCYRAYNIVLLDIVKKLKAL